MSGERVSEALLNFTQLPHDVSVDHVVWQEVPPSSGQLQAGVANAGSTIEWIVQPSNSFLDLKSSFFRFQRRFADTVANLTTPATYVTANAGTVTVAPGSCAVNATAGNTGAPGASAAVGPGTGTFYPIVLPENGQSDILGNLKIFVNGTDVTDNFGNLGFYSQFIKKMLKKDAGWGDASVARGLIPSTNNATCANVQNVTQVNGSLCYGQYGLPLQQSITAGGVPNGSFTGMTVAPISSQAGPGSMQGYYLESAIYQDGSAGAGTFLLQPSADSTAANAGWQIIPYVSGENGMMESSPARQAHGMKVFLPNGNAVVNTVPALDSEYIMELNTSVFDSPVCLPPGCELRVQMTLATDAQMTHCAPIGAYPFTAATKGVTSTSNIYLELKRVYATESALNSFNESLNQVTYKMPFLRSRITARPLPPAPNSLFASNVMTFSQRPDCVVIMLPSTATVSGGGYYESPIATSAASDPIANGTPLRQQSGIPGQVQATKTPTLVRSAGALVQITQAFIDLSGTQYPSQPFTSNGFRNMARLYSAYQELACGWGGANSPCLSYDGFCSSYTLLCFDTRQSLGDELGELESEPGNYDLGINLTYALPPGASTALGSSTAIICALGTGYVVIDGSRTVSNAGFY